MWAHTVKLHCCNFDSYNYLSKPCVNKPRFSPNRKDETNATIPAKSDEAVRAYKRRLSKKKKKSFGP